MPFWGGGAVVWLGLLVFFVAGGVVREKWTAPRMGEAPARRAHTLLGCAVALLAAWGLVRVTGMRDAGLLWGLGCVWLAATVVFECVFGRCVLRLSWSALAPDYNIIKGRLWPVFLLTLALAPWLAARLAGQ